MDNVEVKGADVMAVTDALVGCIDQLHEQYTSSTIVAALILFTRFLVTGVPLSEIAAQAALTEYFAHLPKDGDNAADHES